MNYKPQLLHAALSPCLVSVVSVFFSIHTPVDWQVVVVSVGVGVGGCGEEEGSAVLQPPSGTNTPTPATLSPTHSLTHSHPAGGTNTPALTPEHTPHPAVTHTCISRPQLREFLVLVCHLSLLFREAHTVPACAGGRRGTPGLFSLGEQVDLS